MFVATAFQNDPEISGVFSLDPNGRFQRFTGDLAAAERLEFDTVGYFQGDLFAIGRAAVGGVNAIWRIDAAGEARPFATSDKSLARGLVFAPDGAVIVAEYWPDDHLVTIIRVTSATVHSWSG